MKKTVVKFGGSNLKSKDDFARLIRVVNLYKEPVVIVVSALYGVTDLLVDILKQAVNDETAIERIKHSLASVHSHIIDTYITDEGFREETIKCILQRVDELEKYLRGIHYLGEIPEFVEDRVLSYGERLSSLVLTSVLNFHDIPSRECLPESLGLFTNGEYRNASVDFSVSQEAVQRSLNGDHVCVVPGFYGISTDSRVTLFGRGGSDYTAAALARCIDAPSVDLWKDVPGFMSADPKLVDHPVAIHRLSYDEAAELSYFGAHILHPRTFEPVAETKTPIRLFNINDIPEDLEPLTVIRDEIFVKEDVIKSVTFSDDFGILQLHGAGVGIKPGVMAKVTTALNDNRININSIITAQTSINLMISRHDLEKGLRVIKDIGLFVVDNVVVFDDISVIAVVGDGILEKPGIAARVFGAVSEHHINIHTISSGASKSATYFIIDKGDREKAVQAIHDEFFRPPLSESAVLEREESYRTVAQFEPPNSGNWLPYII